MKTVNDLKNQEAGTYVSGTVAGTITGTKNIATKTGKTMSVGKLDDGDTIDLQSFDLDLTRWEGQSVTLSGKGIKRDEYNGYAKLALGKSVKIVAGDAPAVSVAPQTAPAPAAKANTNHPATVGLAAKIIVDLERIRNESIRIYNETVIARGGDELVQPDSERLTANSAHWDRDLTVWIERLQKAERGEL